MNGRRPEKSDPDGRAKRPPESADDTNVVRIGDRIRPAARELFGFEDDPGGSEDDPGGPAHDPSAA